VCYGKKKVEIEGKDACLFLSGETGEEDENFHHHHFGDSHPLDAAFVCENIASL
jgi:hypothetical protein